MESFKTFSWKIIVYTICEYFIKLVYLIYIHINLFRHKSDWVPCQDLHCLQNNLPQVSSWGVVKSLPFPLQELGRPKCYPYWPQDPGSENKLIFGDVSTCYDKNRCSLAKLKFLGCKCFIIHNGFSTIQNWSFYLSNSFKFNLNMV